MSQDMCVGAPPFSELGANTWRMENVLAGKKEKCEPGKH